MRIPLVILLAVPASIAYGQIYGGPSISGMSGVNAGRLPGRGDGYTFFVNVSGVADGGLTPVVADQYGNLVRYGVGYGLDTTFGVYGTHRTRRTDYGLAYMGGYRAYTVEKYFNGSDNMLGFDTSTRVSRRWQWVTNTRAATLSRPLGGWYNYGNLGGAPGSGIAGTPADNIYDNRYYYFQHTQQATYLATARLAFSFGGTGVIMRRQSSSLAGMNAYGANGVMSYRLNSRSTVSLLYDYFKFDYTRAFGESDVQQLMVQLSRAITRRWTMNLGAGAFRVDTLGLISVAPDPAVIALFGDVKVIETFNRKKTYVAALADIEGNFQRYSVRIGYDRRPSPGNGVYLTSATDNFNANFAYLGIRRLSLNIGANAARFASVGQQTLGNYLTYGGGGGATYHIGKGLSATTRADIRHSEVQ